MSENVESLKWTGYVREFAVTGYDVNSAEITFVVRNINDERAFDITTIHLPQVFSAMATVLLAAYQMNAVVEVSYFEVLDGTPIATAVKIARYLS